MTTDTIKDTRSVGSRCGSSEKAADGRNDNVWTALLVVPLPLVNAQTHALTATLYDASKGCSNSSSTGHGRDFPRDRPSEFVVAIFDNVPT